MVTPTLVVRKTPGSHFQSGTTSQRQTYRHDLRRPLNSQKVAGSSKTAAFAASDNWRARALLDTAVCKTKPLESKCKMDSEEHKETSRLACDTHRYNANEKYKMELCRTWNETGNCPYGKRCQYAHGVEELRCPTAEKPSAYKTVRCRNFWELGHCPYGKRCRFVHDEAVGFDEEKAKQISKHPKYKTKICTTFAETGMCPYGERCAFIHEKTENCTKEDDVASPPTCVHRTTSQNMENDIFAMHVKPLLPQHITSEEAEKMSVQDVALLASAQTIPLRRQSSGDELSRCSRLYMWKQRDLN